MMSHFHSRITLLAILTSGLFTGCNKDSDPLASLDARYTDVMVSLNAADRDTSRNVRNREARQRKIKAEEARVALFHELRVQKEIADAAEAPSPWQHKAQLYQQQLALIKPWTEEEKAEETKLIAKLDEARAQPTTWTSADGHTEVSLNHRWKQVSLDAEKITHEEREDLANQYVHTRVGMINADLQALIRLRNKVAQREGYDNYWQLALAANGQTPEQVEATLQELTAVVRPLNKQMYDYLSAQAAEHGCALNFANAPFVRRRAGLEEGRDQADLLFDADLAEDRVMTAFQDMGIPTDGWQIHTGPQRYVRPGVYGFPIHPPEYVSIVMSQDRRWSVWQYEALAHEGGHAVWWKLIDPEQAASPVLWSPPDQWFEGFAHFFERMVFEPGYTARYVPELNAYQREALRVWRARDAVSQITDAIVQTQVERRLYEDPTNLVALTRFASETRSQLTHITPPVATEEGLIYDPSLVSSILWSYPGYSQTFLYAWLTESWLYAAVTAQVGDPIANAKVGPLLRDRIVRADPSTTFPERVTAMLPGERTAPLKAYLEGPPTAAPAETPPTP